jgi:hypothetical protein
VRKKQNKNKNNTENSLLQHTSDMANNNHNHNPSSSSISNSPSLPTKKRARSQTTEVNPLDDEDDEVHTPALFNLFSRLPNKRECGYRGSIKLLRNNYGGKPLFVLEPPPIIPTVHRKTQRLGLAYFRSFHPPETVAWGSVATSARGASELLTGEYD